MWRWREARWREVRTAQISKADRDLFERYGEAVIGSVLAGGFNPTAPELRTILPGAAGPGKFKEAADWLTERADSNERRDRWISDRDFYLEIVIIALISIEIVLSLYFGFRGLHEGRQQAAILEQMKTSTADTATAMKAATTSLKILAEEQTTALQIFQKEQADRLAQLAKKPELALYVGHVPLAKAHGPIKPSQESENNAAFNFVLKNVGDATANKLIFRTLLPPDVSLNSWPNFTPAADLPDRPVHAFLYYQDSLRSKNYTPISITFIFPKGHTPFRVAFNADSEEIRTDTPLGTLTISPRKPQN